MIDKCEHAKFIISRFDHYYESINNKSTFYIALNTFIFGGICVGYLSLYNKIKQDATTPAFLISLLLLSFCWLSIYFTIIALKPFLKDKDQSKEIPSLIFFGGIARHELAYFEEKFNKLDDAAALSDLVQQVHCLAQGLDKKYKKLKWASLFLVAQFFVMLPLFFIIIKNLKSQ